MAHGDQGHAALTLWDRLGPLVLASASPRRSELWAAAGARFEVDPADVDEAGDLDERPVALVERLALDKARAVAAARGTGVVLGGDTLVVRDDVALGKPADVDEARAMLVSLAGREHEVISGVALVDAARGLERSGVAASRVSFGPLSEEDLAAYLAGDEWRGKAGAYAIQGDAAAFASVVEGDWDTVVGLPVGLVTRLAEDLLEERAERKP